MKRRTLLAGAASLLVAKQMLAEPQGGKTEQPATPLAKMTEATLVGVYGLREPELKGSMVVVLEARTRGQFMTIWIGESEGYSINTHLQGTKMSRPLSHDFMAEVVKALDGEIESVGISFKDETFYATTTIVGHGKTTKVDSRPSDAIALAVRFSAPIFVVSDLLKTSTLQKVWADVREQSAQLAKEMREQPKPE